MNPERRSRYSRTPPVAVESPVMSPVFWSEGCAEPIPQPVHRERRSRPPLSGVIMGGSLMAFLTLLIALPQRSSLSSLLPPVPCAEIVQPQASLSNEKVLQLLTIPERQSMATVRDLLAEPYCRLPPMEVRAGVTAERDAYPLATAPQTWLVILHENEEYAGYAFKTQD